MQFDTKTAFLHGELNEEIYMDLPEGMMEDRHLVCRLKKSLYGLKQASRCWNQRFNDSLKRLGFQQCQADRCAYVGIFQGQTVVIGIYVDNGLIFAQNKETAMKIIDQLKQVFEITVSESGYFLGMGIMQDEKDGSIFIHGTSYIDRLIKKFNMEDAKIKSVPADPHVKLTSNHENKEDLKNIPYRELVGSLMFVALTTRPDIMFAVNFLSRFQTNYNRNHWNQLKQIIRYLKGTKDLGILYSKNCSNAELIGFSDSDHANDPETARSTTGYVFLMSGGPITWACRRQESVSLSTTEAEYVAASLAAREAVWLRHLLLEIGEEQVHATTLCIDNRSAIKLVQNPIFHKRTKHIKVAYHFIRERYEDNEIDVKYVSTKEQLADIFTKALPNANFQNIRSSLNIRNK